MVGLPVALHGSIDMQIQCKPRSLKAASGCTVRRTPVHSAGFQRPQIPYNIIYHYGAGHNNNKWHLYSANSVKSISALQVLLLLGGLPVADAEF